jgi:hypothetical protein
MRNRRENGELQRGAHPESTPTGAGDKPIESVGRVLTTTRRPEAGTWPHGRPSSPHTNEEVKPSPKIAPLPPTCPSDERTRRLSVLGPVGDFSADLARPGATALTEARRWHVDRGAAPLRADDGARTERPTGERRRDVYGCVSRTEVDCATACSLSGRPDDIVRPALHGVRGRAAITLKSPEWASLMYAGRRRQGEEVAGPGERERWRRTERIARAEPG